MSDSTDPAPSNSDPFLPSLTQLRAFGEVARLSSISQASEELRRSQSAVTQAIQRLEEELGVGLFARTSTGSYLTDEGDILYERANKCFARIEASIRNILSATENDNGQITAIARRITRAQIRSLTAVHEHGSFAQSARYANVSITSLQRSARSLEKQVGRPLLVSTAHGIKTNATGAKLAEDLLLAARELEWAAEEINARRGKLEGQLLIGSLLQAGNPFIAVELDRFVQDFPNAHIRVSHGSYDELLAKLQVGSIDFLVGLLKNPPPVDDVREDALAKDPYVVVARKGHPLSQRARVTKQELQTFEWIAPRRSAQRRRPFEDIFGGVRLPPSRIETHSLLTILVLLANSDRMALMTRSELELDARLGSQLTTIDYTIAEPPAEIGVTTRIDWQPTTLQQAFLRFLHSRTGSTSVQ